MKTRSCSPHPCKTKGTFVKFHRELKRVVVYRTCRNCMRVKATVITEKKLEEVTTIEAPKEHTSASRPSGVLDFGGKIVAFGSQ